MQKCCSATLVGKTPTNTVQEGIEILKDIKGDTSTLPGIKGDTSILPEIKAGIDNMNIKFDSFIHGQEGHNLRLEKILEKLAER